MTQVQYLAFLEKMWRNSGKTLCARCPDRVNQPPSAEWNWYVYISFYTCIDFFYTFLFICIPLFHRSLFTGHVPCPFCVSLVVCRCLDRIYVSLIYVQVSFIRLFSHVYLSFIGHFSQVYVSFTGHFCVCVRAYVCIYIYVPLFDMCIFKSTPLFYRSRFTCVRPFCVSLFILRCPDRIHISFTYV